MFTVHPNVVTGTFLPAPGYIAGGAAKIEKVNHELILTLSNDFVTEFHIATHIYLANSTNGGEVRSQGVDLGQIFMNGMTTINITQLNPEIVFGDYKYVISLCKPASVTFGYAEVK